MRGFSNAIMFIFFFAAFIIVLYMGTRTFMELTADEVSWVKESIHNAELREYIQYSQNSECNTDTNTIRIQYVGDIPEYWVRLVCADYYDYNTLCVMNVVGGGKVISMVEGIFVKEIIYELNTCGVSLVNACANKRLTCYVSGRYDVVPIVFS